MLIYHMLLRRETIEEHEEAKTKIEMNLYGKKLPKDLRLHASHDHLDLSCSIFEVLLGVLKEYE